MNWFKRLCLFLFGLMGLFALCALSLTWVGPWTRQARSMLEVWWYFGILEVCVCATGLGLLVAVLVALFYPRNPSETEIAQVDGGKITVTRQAIVSQVRHIIESDGRCKATSVRVKVRKRGNVRVNVRVKPHAPINVVEYGEELYDKLNKGLAEVCGESVKSVNVVFTEPQRIGAQAQASSDTDGVTVTPESGDGQGSANQSISVNPASMGWGRESDVSEDQAEEPAIIEGEAITSSESFADDVTDDQAFETAPTISLSSQTDDYASDETEEV